MTTEATPTRQLMWLGVMVLLVLAGLCTIFALVATAAQAWQEHAQQQWPEVTAHVDTCGMERISSGRRQRFHIRCRLTYEVAGQQNATDVYSTNVPGPEVQQYPPNQIGPFQNWVDEHPSGTSILLRYDPADHTRVVLVSTPMPRGEPHTQRNIKLLALFASIFVVLLVVAQSIRPRSAG